MTLMMMIARNPSSSFELLEATIYQRNLLERERESQHAGSTTSQRVRESVCSKLEAEEGAAHADVAPSSVANFATT